MKKVHGTPRHWRTTQTAKLVSRLTLATPQSIRLLEEEDRDPKRLLEFTSDPERLELALAEAFRMLYAGHAITIPNEKLVYLDRSESEEATHDSPIWRGSLEGSGLEGDECQDQKSLMLERIDATKFWGMWAQGSGIERITGPLAVGAVRLDVQVAHALYRQPGQRTLRWLKKQWGDRVRQIYFPGTIYRSSKGPFVCGLWQDTTTTWAFRDKLLAEIFEKDQVFLYLR